ncbi:MAG: hypothetical protein AAF997_22570, partial [Myxococcota bacterium]
MGALATGTLDSGAFAGGALPAGILEPAEEGGVVSTGCAAGTAPEAVRIRSMTSAACVDRSSGRLARTLLR